MEELYRVGVDLGGTKTEVILLDPDGQERFRKRRPTPREEGYESILQTILLLVKEATGSIPSGFSWTLGMGIPGIIDGRSGVVMNANTTLLIGHPLKSDLEKELNHSIAIENDANCFTMAEAKAGAARNYSTVFGVIMGTGCGGGIAFDGRIHHGPHGIAGEWGHFSVDPGGPLCWCGNRGCIETLISGSGVEARYLDRFRINKTMPEIVEGFRAARAEESEIFLQFLEDFGRSLGGLISVLDPDAVVLGGGLSHIEELYSAGYEKIKKYVFHKDLQTPLLKNTLGDSAGVIGAAWIGLL